MVETSVLQVVPLGQPPWPTFDPFLFCVHHDDAYPAGNDRLGPEASLAGRQIGQDFAGIDGWRMYHGDVVPGFPEHPHRGFETVTIVRRGLVDHSDSLGATARFGSGDVQWLTAGKGIEHSEMFPLVDRTRPNPLELFQIWLNLPRSSKLAAPYFTMFWKSDVSVRTSEDADGRRIDVQVVAGRLGDHVAPPPPPDSWAARPEAHVAIWTIRMDPGARWRLPKAQADLGRTLYFFGGSALRLDGQAIPPRSGVRVRSDRDLELEAGPEPVELLLLQGRPIGEPVTQYGPFVMTTREEILQAFADYRETGFGGWPWPAPGPVHARDKGRFARHPDGRIEEP